LRYRAVVGLQPQVYRSSCMRNLKFAILAGLAMIIVSPFLPWVELNTQIHPEGELGMRDLARELLTERGITIPVLEAGSRRSDSQTGFELYRGTRLLILAVGSAIIFVVFKRAWRLYVLIVTSVVMASLPILALTDPVYRGAAAISTAKSTIAWKDPAGLISRSNRAKGHISR